jgi:hypothetical protein
MLTALSGDPMHTLELDVRLGAKPAEQAHVAARGTCDASERVHQHMRLCNRA